MFLLKSGVAMSAPEETAPVQIGVAYRLAVAVPVQVRWVRGRRVERSEQSRLDGIESRLIVRVLVPRDPPSTYAAGDGRPSG